MAQLTVPTNISLMSDEEVKSYRNRYEAAAAKVDSLPFATVSDDDKQAYIDYQSEFVARAQRKVDESTPGTTSYGKYAASLSEDTAHARYAVTMAMTSN